MSPRSSVPSVLGLLLCLALSAHAAAQQIAPVRDADPEAIAARVEVALGALAKVDPAQAASLGDAVNAAPGGDAAAIQRAIDGACLLEVAINPESRVKVAPGPVDHDLPSGAWRSFLVKVHNVAGVTSPLRVSIQQRSRSGRDEWLEIALYEEAPLESELTGALVEYRVIRLRTDAVGFRAAVIAMDVGQGTADIGFRNDTLMTFRCKTP